MNAQVEKSRSEPSLLEWIVGKLFEDLASKNERFEYYRHDTDKREELSDLIKQMLKSSKSIRRREFMSDGEVYLSVRSVVFKALTMPPDENNN